MSMRDTVRPRFQQSVPFLLLCLLLVVLWTAGGASRPDSSGQILVRVAAAACLIGVILFGDWPKLAGVKPVASMLVFALFVAFAHLVPLPPDVWSVLPGRALFIEAAALAKQEQPWRPLSIVPGATVNAMSSLIVPAAVLYIFAAIRAEDRARLPGVALALIFASTLIGLLQFSGASFNNPFVNDVPGSVSGTFANRNHFALFQAFGCLLAPIWAFHGGRDPGWRAPAAVGLVLLFALTILASGSRAGLLLGFFGLVSSLVIVREAIRKSLRRYPRWVFPALIGAVFVLIVMFVLISIAADRAVAINRALELDPADDLRKRAMPTVMEMIRIYFPVGSGLGAFDPVYRIHERFDLLAVEYFNHAHNDFLEIALDTGLVGIVALAVSIMWWAWASFRAWRAGRSVLHAIPKLGSAMILMVLAASVVDYPARTPLIMAMLILAAAWLSCGGEERGDRALPGAVGPL